MISLAKLVFYYTDTEKPALDDISLEIPDGAFVLVTGPSGSGKTTFLRVLNGLVPHFYGGRIGGRVEVYGLEARRETVRSLSSYVGMVFQDSTAQFVTDTVESEIAFGLENTGLASEEIARRVDETSGMMGLRDLMGRQTSTLSGGERQKTAIASILAMRPRVLALDEPTAELDPEAAAELLELLVRLNKEEGLTVILAEHRLERVIQFADSIIELQDGQAEMGPAAEMAGKIVNAPPVVELGRRLGWEPLALSVGEAKTRVRGTESIGIIGTQGSMGSRVENKDYKEYSDKVERVEVVDKVPGTVPGTLSTGLGEFSTTPEQEGIKVWARGVGFGYGGKTVLKNVDLSFYAGEVTALMGPNGAGKTTLLKLLCGLLKPAEGRVTIGGLDTAKASSKDIFAKVGYVPQRPGALLFAETVGEEIQGSTKSTRSTKSTGIIGTQGSMGRRGDHLDEIATSRLEGAPRNDGSLIREFGLEGHVGDYPRDLSQGEQQRVALAAILANDPTIILFDEPTHGLDFTAKKDLSKRLRLLAEEGKAVIMATHDVETAAGVADRVIFIDEGKVAADGSPREVMPKIHMLRTQMNEIYGGTVLTVEDALQGV